MSQDNNPRLTRSTAQRSASQSSLPSGGVDDNERSLSPPTSPRGGLRTTPSHRTTRPEELTATSVFTTPRSTNVTPITAAIVPPPQPPHDANRFGGLAATTVDESETEDDDGTTLSEPLTSPRPDDVNVPDTPTLTRKIDSCLVDLQQEMVAATDPAWSAPIGSLQKELRSGLAHNLALFQQGLAGNLALYNKSIADIDTKLGLFEQGFQETAQLAATVKEELDNKFGLVQELEVQITSVRDDIAGRLDTMEAAITKLSDEVHTITSTLGHVTQTEIPKLKRRVTAISHTDGSTTRTPPDDNPDDNPAPSQPTDPPPDILPPTRRVLPSRPTAPVHVDTDSSPVDFELHNSHFGAGIDADGPTLSPNERSRSAYDNFRANNPDLRAYRDETHHRPDVSHPGAPRSAMRVNRIPPGPIESPRNRDRDSRARELGVNRSDISALATARYHCGFDDGVDPLTSLTLAEVGYTNIGSDDVVACHNAIIEVHRRVLQSWHNSTNNTFGPQVNRIVTKSLKLFPVLESTNTSDMVDFYDRLQETAADHLTALMPFDAILLRFGFEGLCVPGLGVTRYARMGKALMELLPRLLPGSLSPQINAALYAVRYESTNGYDYLWRVLELTVPGFDPIVPIQLPVWADHTDIFHFVQGYLLYFRLQAKQNFHYDERTRSGIFLRAIQHSDYADTVTTLQSQVNTYREFDEGYLPNHLRLHGLATSIHQNSMSRQHDIGNPRVRRIAGDMTPVQGIPRVYRVDRQRGDDRRGGYGSRGGFDLDRDRAQGGFDRDRGYGNAGGPSPRAAPPRDRDRPRKPRGPVSNPDRNRRPYLADVQCDACKRVGHVAKHCDMLATAICLERYMKNVLSPSVRDTIETEWLARWKDKLGNPTATPRQVLRAYVADLDITVAHLDDEIEWDLWDDEDVMAEDADVPHN